MAGHRKALIIAVDDYEHPGLRRLRSPVADAEVLGTVLADPRIGDFAVEVVRNQPAHEIESRIEDLFCDAMADDVLVVHFSGHGLKSEAGDLFFAARNTRPNRLASTAVPADFVQRCVRTSPSRSIVLFLDCCYGGAFGQGVAVRAAGNVHVLDSFPSGRLGGGRGRAVITASNAIEYAFEGERLSDDSHPTPSLFTAALVQGLSTGEADRDEDGFVSLNELYDYVFDRVREQNPNQTPSRDIEMQGELYLAKSGRRRLRPTPLPPDLRAAAEDANPYTRLGAVSELRSRLLSDNLPVAAGAREALVTMASSDTQLVAGAATAALADLVLRLTPTSLDFGYVPIGTPTSPRRVDLTGPPLARHVTVQTSEPWIRVQDRDEAYEVSLSPQSEGMVSGTVTFSGTGGEATLTVRAQNVSESRVAEKPVLESPQRSAQPHLVPQPQANAEYAAPAPQLPESRKSLTDPTHSGTPADMVSNTRAATTSDSDAGARAEPHAEFSRLPYAPDQQANSRPADQMAGTAAVPQPARPKKRWYGSYPIWVAIVGLILALLSPANSALQGVGLLVFFGGLVFTVATMIAANRSQGGEGDATRRGKR